MTFDLAVEAMAGKIPQGWLIEPFRYHAALVDETNQRKNLDLLSLSSTGAIAPRTEDGGLGRQAPAEQTIERYWVVKPGNLVVNPMWLVGGGIGVSQATGAVSPDYRVYKLAPHLHPRYIHHLLRSGAYRDQYRLYTRADTTFDRRVSKINFHAMPIIIPPLEEQRRIANFLDAETARIDRLRTLKSKQLDLLTERLVNTSSERVIPGIGDLSIPRSKPYPWLPSSICLARLGHFVKIQTGITIDSGRSNAPDDVVLPYLRVANVQDGHIDLDEIKEIKVPLAMARRSTLIKGDVVITEANGNPDNLGRGAVWDGRIKTMVHQNHIFALRPDCRFLIPEYLSLVLATIHGRAYFKSTASQVGIATTSSSKIAAMPVPMMSVREQLEIVAACAKIRASTDAVTKPLRAHLYLLEERRRALITAAVTGSLM